MRATPPRHRLVGKEEEKSTAAAQPASLPAPPEEEPREEGVPRVEGGFTACRVGGWYQPCARRRSRHRVKVSGR